MPITIRPEQLDAPPPLVVRPDELDKVDLPKARPAPTVRGGLEPPPLPKPPIPFALRSDQQQMQDMESTRQDIVREAAKRNIPLRESPDFGLGPVVEGGTRIVGGLQKIATAPGLPAKARGTSDVIRGAMEVGSMGIPSAVIAHPVRTALALGAGTAAQYGTERGLQAAGVNPDYAALASDVAAIGAGAFAGTRPQRAPVAPEPPPPMPVAKPVEQAPPVFKSAEESAAIFRAKGTPRPQTARESAAVFQTSARPVVPETGVPENIARAQAAREEAARQLGTRWEDLGNSERIAIDDLIAEGKAGTPQGPPTTKPRQVGVPLGTRRPGTITVRPEEVQPAKQVEPAPKLPAAEGVTAAGFTVRPEELNLAHQASPMPDGATIAVDEAGIQPRGVGEGPQVLEPRSTSYPVRIGAPTEVRVPGEDTRYETRYEVRELADIQPSHNGHTFQANTEYQHRNDRNYADPSNQERVVVNSSPQRFDPAYLINDNPTATNGPPVIDQNGNTLGGNSRVMILQRVFRDNPEGALGYRNSLVAKAAQFGIDPASLEGMREPVLVRTLASPEVQKGAITAFNKRETAELTPSEQATTDARSLSPTATHYLTEALEQAGPEATLTEVLSGRRGAEIINKLVDDGVFTMQEKPRLVDAKTGAVTSHAKERISKMLLGDFFADSEQMQRAEPSLRNKLERIAAPMMTLKGAPEWDLTPTLRESLNLLEYARAHGLRNMSDVVSQEDMFGDVPQFSDKAVQLATALRDFTPTALTRAFRRYAVEGYDNGTENMFGKSTPEDAFEAAFRNPERGAISINPQAIRQAAEEKALEYRTQLIDRLAPLHALVKGKGLTVDSDPYVAARNYAGHYGKIENRLDRLAGILPKGSFFTSLIGRRPELLRDTTDLMQLERHIELGMRPDLAGKYQIPGNRSVAGVQQELAAMQQRLGPQKWAQVQQLAGKLRGYMNGMLKEAADAGVISKSTYQAILAKNQKYIPFERLEYLADELDKMPHGSNSFNVPVQKVIKRIEGSGKEIADPIEAIIRRTSKTVSLIERNKVAQKVAALSSDPAFKGVVEPIGKGGFVPAGMDTMAVLRNGVKYEYAVPANVGKALKGMNVEAVDLVTKWASRSAAALRAGATSLNVGFIPANAIRDFQTATIVSKVGFTPVDWVRGFAESINHGQDFESYREHGGAFSGFFGSQKAVPTKARQLTAPKSLRAAKTILNPVELLRWSAEHIEMAPRLGVFKRSQRAGLSPTESAFNSREATVDFAKAGTTLKVVNQWIPFLNARLQGTVNMLGAVKNRPGRAVLGLTAVVGAPTVLTYLNNTRNHKAVWNDISQTEKDNNFLIIYGDGKNERGDYTDVMKLPKGDAKAFGNPLESFLSYLDKNNPKALDQLAMQAVSDLSPVPFERNGRFSPTAVASAALPPLVKAGIEGAFNKNLYTEREIVPTRGPYGDMTKASSENQFTADTPRVFVEAGKRLGVSPMKLQNAVGTQFGGLGRQVTDPGTAGNQVVRRFSGARGRELESQRFDKLGKIEQGTTDERIETERKAEAVFGELNALSVQKRQQRARELMTSGQLTEPVLAAIEKAIDAKTSGLSRFEAHIRQAPVQTRARYIVQELRTLPPAERSRLIQDWIDKKIVTPQVLQGIESEISKPVSGR